MLVQRTFLILIICLLSSCFARGGVMGEVRVNIDASLEDIHKAVVTTLRIEKITIEEDKSDAMTSLVKGRYADGEKLTIHAEKLTQKASTMTIQIGLFGNELRSNALLEEIGRRLPKNAVHAPPVTTDQRSATETAAPQP